MVTLILSPTVIQANMTYSCSSLKGGPIPDAIMLSSDSEPGTPQKPVVVKVSSSDSEPGTPQKPVVTKVSSSDSEPETLQKHMVTNLSSDSENEPSHQPVEKAGLSYGSRYDWYRNQTLTCKAMT